MAFVWVLKPLHRFQKRQYANIDIVLTELKGYGLRAEDFIPKYVITSVGLGFLLTGWMGRDTFIYEYVGDVVKPSTFQKRMRDYALEGIEHFYFMMLQKDEVSHSPNLVFRPIILSYCSFSLSTQQKAEELVVSPTTAATPTVMSQNGLSASMYGWVSSRNGISRSTKN